MITPSLTYDRQGYRMGRARAIMTRLSKHKIYSVGVARGLMVDEVPEAPDVVDCLVTEKGLIQFNK